MPFSSASLPRAAIDTNEPVHRRGPRGWRLLRDLWQMRRDRITLVTRARADFGDVVHFHLGPRRLVLVSDPAAIRRVLIDNDTNYCKGLGLVDARPMLGEGLLTSEGSVWASRRRLLHPSFHGEALVRFSDAVLAAARDTERTWRRAPRGSIDLGLDMRRLALLAFAGGVLGIDATPRRDALLEAFAVVETWAMRRSVAIVRVPVRVPTAANRRLRRALRVLHEFIDDALAAARGPNAAPLSAVLASLDDDGECAHAARDELMTLLLAGHETTGAAMAWTWACLATHPAAATAVRAELAAVIGSRDPQLADVSRLPYLRAVVDEAVRLYPPVWLIPRRAIARDVIDGDTITPGTDVLLSVYGLHRNPRFWPAPDRFDPERFLSEASGRRAPGAYVPFGAGPRACIGARFAISETMLAIGYLARRFHLSGGFASARPEASLTLRFPPHSCDRARDRQCNRVTEVPMRSCGRDSLGVAATRCE